MRKREVVETVDLTGCILIDTRELQKVTSCGRDGAIKLGTAANARVRLGRRVLWNVNKIRAYLDQISE